MKIPFATLFFTNDLGSRTASSAVPFRPPRTFSSMPGAFPLLFLNHLGSRTASSAVPFRPPRTFSSIPGAFPLLFLNHLGSRTASSAVPFRPPRTFSSMPGAFPLLFLLGLYAFLGPSPASADGCFVHASEWRQPEVVPRIPRQRALLTFDGSQERMMVESSFEGDGERFGWLVPVPAAPTQFEAATPGLLATLALNTQPRIEWQGVDAENVQTGLGFALFILVLLILAYVFDGIPPLYLGMLLGIGLAVFLFVQFIAPVFQTVTWSYGLDSQCESLPAPQVAGVTVTSSTVVGNFAVEVLKADSSAALNDWLKRNQYSPLPARAIPIANQYVQEKWQFVAAKLRRSGAGLSRPHPLAIAFPTDKLIYPMRLTAVAQTPLKLELFVIANRRASCAGLTTEFCDYFSIPRPGSSKSERNLTTATLALRRVGFSSGHHLDHPLALSWLGESCILTRLAGTLAPEAMTARPDLQLARWPADDQNVLYLRSREALGRSLGPGVLVLWRHRLSLSSFLPNSL